MVYRRVQAENERFERMQRGKEESSRPFYQQQREERGVRVSGGGRLDSPLRASNASSIHSTSYSGEGFESYVEEEEKEVVHKISVKPE